MGKCPVKRCKWSGPAEKYGAHYSRAHYKSRAKLDKGKVKTFKKPGFAKGKKRR